MKTIRTFMTVFVFAPVVLGALDARAQEASLRPAQADVELALSGDLARLVNSEMTGFGLGVGVGYFVTDWLEIGLGGTLAYQSPRSSAADSRIDAQSKDRAAGPLGLRQDRLTSGNIGSSSGGWVGSGQLLLRLFPLAASDALPKYLAPFIGVELGGLFSEDVDPFVLASGSLGIHFLISKNVAITPELGYGLVYSTDSQARFGSDLSKTEHIFGMNWGLSLFF